MATTSGRGDGITEYCDRCESDTVHSVTIQIRTESSKQENMEFSREPYRISTCNRCGTQQSQRMNNA
ncbi:MULTISPECIES: DUF7835 family putative zinc beta-ribbon protein [Natronococcus]|uniref:DUF7835 family putative zinc beta-ribbon protein n=1 Tax=Natronococcus TaxID=29287 RepID=UPI0009FBAF49|nr:MULTISPECIES: hypothetical protein [Natronococcus]NKE36518.1 hypothetical protein [Natronococcus sp. JC468]